MTVDEFVTNSNFTKEYDTPDGAVFDCGKLDLETSVTWVSTGLGDEVDVWKYSFSWIENGKMKHLHFTEGDVLFEEELKTLQGLTSEE